MTIAIAYIIINKPTSPIVYVNPQTIQGTVGQDFTVNISILNVVDLYGWDFKLRWNTAILDAINVTEGAFLKNGGDTFFVSPTMNNTEGYIIARCTLFGNVSGVSGNGALATIRFHIKNSGHCDLNLYDTMLVNSNEQLVTHAVNDGRLDATP